MLILSCPFQSTWDISAKLLICLTESGNTAKVVSKYRPACPILAVTANEGYETLLVKPGLTSHPHFFYSAARRLLISKGVIPLKVDSMKGTEKVLETAFHYARDVIHAVQAGDVVVILSGQMEGISGATNMFKVAQVPSAH